MLKVKLECDLQLTVATALSDRFADMVKELDPRAEFPAAKLFATHHVQATNEASDSGQDMKDSVRLDALVASDVLRANKASFSASWLLNFLFLRSVTFLYRFPFIFMQATAFSCRLKPTREGTSLIC